jgi:hypothetical protein
LTIVIKDVSMTEELDHKALTAVRGGDNFRLVGPPLWERYLPPSLPIGFPSPIPFPGEVGGQCPEHFDPARLQTAHS